MSAPKVWPVYVRVGPLAPLRIGDVTPGSEGGLRGVAAVLRYAAETLEADGLAAGEPPPDSIEIVDERSVVGRLDGTP